MKLGTSTIGYVKGLACTPYGGETLEIEVTGYAGKESFFTSGHLGETLKESIMVSLGYIKSNKDLFKINDEMFNSTLHINFREGGIPKEGPSAGAIITTALLSYLLKKEVPSTISASGEITLLGDILPVGGIREKSVAAIKDGITKVYVSVLNKRDILPKSIKDEKIKEYFAKLGLDYEDVIIVSPKKNYNIDELLLKIKKYKTSKNVYVVGHTNVGKSTLINTLMKNYSEFDSELTMSPLPSTTLNKISIKLNSDLTLIDTPGLVDDGNILNYVDQPTLKKILPKKEIKPKTYQLKKDQALVIGDLLRIDYVEGEKNSFTVFVSNELKVKRINMHKNDELKDLFKHEIDVAYHEDLVINGLGFIKIVEKAKINVYINKDVEVFTRDSLI